MPEPKTFNDTPASPADESAAEVTVVPLDHRTFCNEPTPGSTSEVLMLIHVAATAPMTMGFQTVEICVGHIPLYAREANGRVLPAQHTMALALGTMWSPFDR